jgi:hypothetical protein
LHGFSRPGAGEVCGLETHEASEMLTLTNDKYNYIYIYIKVPVEFAD